MHRRRFLEAGREIVHEVDFYREARPDEQTSYSHRAHMRLMCGWHMSEPHYFGIIDPSSDPQVDCMMCIAAAEDE